MGTLSSRERTDRLMQAIGFSEEDLAANRTGQLTLRQQDNLKQSGVAARRAGPRNLMIGLGMGAVLVVFYAVVIGGNSSALARSAQSLPQVLPYLAIPVVIILAAVGYQVWRARQYNQRMNTGQAPVKRYSGKVKLTIVNYGMTLGGLAVSAAGVDPRQYKLQIGRATFYPPPPVFTAFQNGQKYTVYAVQTSYIPTILTAEGID